MKGDRLYLSNIVECIGQIEQYVACGGWQGGLFLQSHGSVYGDSQFREKEIEHYY